MRLNVEEKAGSPSYISLVSGESGEGVLWNHEESASTWGSFVIPLAGDFHA